ncbi:hypothetical protein FQN57_002966 [Myotisia sp. PD_48]|nr:hypothetical protein FQN57_002966 [Myotisia sp. PD_48]
MTSSLPSSCSWFSFGVEIEFIIRFKISSFSTSKLETTQPSTYAQVIRSVHRYLIGCLRNTGVGVNDYLLPHRDLSSWTVKKLETVEVVKFNVELDEWGFCPVRLATPVMSYACPSFPEIDDVLSYLNENFDILLEDSCCLNVYVGCTDTPDGKNRDSQGIRLAALQNFLLFVSLFEHQLNAIHLPARTTETRRLRPSDLLPHPYFNVRSEIQRCSSVKALCELWDGSAERLGPGSRLLSYSIRDMTAHYNGNVLESGNKTIRFGQHRATMDIWEIYHWVNLAGHIVRFVDRCEPWVWPLAMMFQPSSEHQVKIQDINPIDLFDAIGAIEQGDYYDNRFYQEELCRDMLTDASLGLELLFSVNKGCA